MYSVCDKRSLEVSARLSILRVLFIICYMYKLIDVVHKSFQDSIFVPKFVYSQYYELPCTKENALSCAFFKTKEKMREFNLTIHLVLQAMSLEIGWDCALLEGMLYWLMNYFQCMFFMFAWYLDWYLPAFWSVIRKYILRLFVICNFFWSIGKCMYAVQLMLDLYMIIIYD